MKNLYMIISLILLTGSIAFISCNNNEGFESCSNNQDCEGSKLSNAVCVNHDCMENPCLDTFCGVGTCIHNDNPDTSDIKEIAYCQCDENSLPYEFNNKMICTSKCEYHSDCYPEGLGDCIKGQCDETNFCDTADDCPDGDICDYNLCKPEPIEE